MLKLKIRNGPDKYVMSWPVFIYLGFLCFHLGEHNLIWVWTLTLTLGTGGREGRRLNPRTMLPDLWNSSFKFLFNLAQNLICAVCDFSSGSARYFLLFPLLPLCSPPLQPAKQSSHKFQDVRSLCLRSVQICNARTRFADAWSDYIFFHFI